MLPQRRLARFMVRRIRGGRSSRRRDVVAVEEPLEIRLAFESGGERMEKSVSVTMRTPGDDFELAAGFLFTEGIIGSSRDVEGIQYCLGPQKKEQEYNVVTVHLAPGVAFDPDQLQRNFYTTSSCGVCGKASIEALELSRCPVLPDDRPVIDSDTVVQLGQELKGDQSVFQATGGLHAAGLFNSSGRLVDLCEDVGRHNAVDKLIGRQLLRSEPGEGLPFDDRLLMVSGRASFEIMQKALIAGIPMVVAVGAPSSLAVDVSREFGMTLLGFVRNGRFNIYGGAQRVSLTGSRAVSRGAV